MRTKLNVLIFGLLISGLILSACASAPALAQSSSAEEKNPRTLSVTGTGKAYLVPDIAYISIGVHTEDKEAAKAVTDNTAKSQKVSEALKKFNIDPKDIQTTNFSIYPQQQFDPQGKVVGVLYVVDNTVYVTLRDLKKIGDLLDAVVSAGANTINGITFDVEDKSAALSEARAAAIEDAKKQASELAKAAGITLGPIMTISSYGSYPSPVFEGKGGGGAAMNVAVPISPGQTVLQVDVNVVYIIQ
jgi:uncharacterized protein YggE